AVEPSRYIGQRHHAPLLGRHDDADRPAPVRGRRGDAGGSHGGDPEHHVDGGGHHRAHRRYPALVRGVRLVSESNAELIAEADKRLAGNQWTSGWGVESLGERLTPALEAAERERDEARKEIDRLSRELQVAED